MLRKYTNKVVPISLPEDKGDEVRTLIFISPMTSKRFNRYNAALDFARGVADEPASDISAHLQAADRRTAEQMALLTECTTRVEHAVYTDDEGPDFEKEFPKGRTLTEKEHIRRWYDENMPTQNGQVLAALMDGGKLLELKNGSASSLSGATCGARERAHSTAATSADAGSAAETR